MIVSNITFGSMTWGLRFVSSWKNTMTCFHFGMKNIKYSFFLPPLLPSVACRFLSRCSCNPAFLLEDTDSYLRKRKSHIATLVSCSRKILNQWCTEKMFLSFKSFFSVDFFFKYKSLNHAFRNQLKWQGLSRLEHSTGPNEVSESLGYAPGFKIELLPIK